jgi:hypothetical protein
MERRAAFALILLACATACSYGPPSGPAATTTHTPPPILHFTKGASMNLAVNSSTFRGWTTDLFHRASGGPGGAADLEYAGTESPNSAALYSPVIAVKPNTAYTFSAWIDPTQFARSIGVLMITNTARNVAFGGQLPVRGAARRFSVSALIPQGVTRIRLIYTNAGNTVKKGGRVRFSQPMLRADGVSAPYKP